jgi:hypothetical protein
VFRVRRGLRLASGCCVCLLKQRYVAVRRSCRECVELHRVERVLRAGPYEGITVLEGLLKEAKA